MAFYFSYPGHTCNLWLNIANPRDKYDNSVMCAGKETKSDLKSLGMETDVATHTSKLLLRKKTEHWDINIVLFVNF